LNKAANRVNVIHEDAFDAMKSLLHQKKQYDVIVLDPPAFVKKLKDKKEGLIAYQRSNELALKLLKPGGMLISCSCSMHISMEDLIGTLKRAAYRTQSHLQIVERGHQGPDHPIHLSIPETDYLKALFVRKIS
jgi:23S rRNA (cytosine1962-C5)-methyltransferase